MEIEELRRRIDELDRQMVALISERARCAQQIGQLKRATSLPVYEPNRERVIYENVRAANPGPLPDIELTHIYERIIDVMRALQRDELASRKSASAEGQSANESARQSAGQERNHDRCNAGTRHRRTDSRRHRAPDGTGLQCASHHRSGADHPRRRRHARLIST